MSVASSATLHHAAFIVRDANETARALSDSLGIGPWSVFTLEPTESIVRGEATEFTFRIALAEVGGASYELISPVAGESLYTEHLEAHGEGFHHTCFLYPTLDAQREARAELLGQGRELVQSGRMGDAASFDYFRIPEMGTLLELLFIGEMPEPDALIG